MADIKPFAAFRPRHGMEQTIAALPYDVYSSDEARAYTREHPQSFLAIDRAETQLPEGTPFDAPQVYLRARDLLAKPDLSERDLKIAEARLHRALVRQAVGSGK